MASKILLLTVFTSCLLIVHSEGSLQTEPEAPLDSLPLDLLPQYVQPDESIRYMFDVEYRFSGRPGANLDFAPPNLVVFDPFKDGPSPSIGSAASGKHN